ncbi:UDP-N-acetylmuramate dehydrogenase [Candidatus Tisiphia endosymbiont of Oplodontha viridula]|uniref:UDP-N-acetylmuramate dehydrogenase n=1 Tax=Candidatus Tisiphia endosymbiont of Oplodontha viridula TaxID=3077925 RepID=UPI0035C8915E
MELPKTVGEYRNNYNLSHLTWFKVGGPAEVLFKPLDVQDLANFVSQNQQQRPITVLGAGSNIIIRDVGIDGVVVKLGQNFTNIGFQGDNKLSVGAGCLNYNLAKFCQSQAITGFEFLVGIPGTIGGGVVMNAGAYGSEFKDIIIAIEAIDSRGNFILIPNEKIGFKYRGNNLPKDLIITRAIFKATIGEREMILAKMDEINKNRLATQPIKERTSGSTFANLENHKAWQLIDKAGMRGYRIGGASMSQLHCNFMINHGNSSARDLEDLGDLVKKNVFEDSGISLEWEIKRIGKYA